MSFCWSSNAVKNRIQKVTALHRSELSGCSFDEKLGDRSFLVKVYKVASCNPKFWKSQLVKPSLAQFEA